MARKNLIEVSVDNPAAETSSPMTAARPIAGFVPPAVRNTPIGGITKTLGNITQKFERAQDIEKQLAEGQTIIEIDPALVDSSIVSDRIGIDAVKLAQLSEQIKVHGQQVPILVRPHPDARGRYQVAYGHRRLAAVKVLGIKVRAVVRELSDDQLVVSQGQENNARTNLSYIERALFAVRLEDRSFSRETIMAALGIDKAALSKMVSVVRQVPIELIEAIGAAPEIGRRRWMELADLLPKADVKNLLASLSEPETKALSSDQRFQAVVDALTTKPERPPESNGALKSWAPADKSVRVSLRAHGKTATIAIGAVNGPLFAAYITERLDDLYADWKSKQEN
ncbi:MAG: plasmid partitioning protein RepB [Mesorhizobium sp.]|uniref:plasmid partitioning protein RepB n=1 Tax=Mesorhizobium sp. TaxID=1871066 RepID=UPI000FE370BD|nr:plasmid partitioning protein RepB [Mesorhizobium sp.]RWJ04907.1 MAG: plasmid partitioning protein RepB [Mesorhizobium sp.]RWJ11962.1 MAG: plasmid partitioning protein RepB [Mesorhizobium sp.]